MLREIRYGVKTKTGTLIPTNKVWNEARLAARDRAAAPPIPLAKKRPAQEGHAVKRPMNAPKPPTYARVFAVMTVGYALFYSVVSSTLAFRPLDSSNMFIGMMRNPICSVEYIVNLGICPMGPQQKAVTMEGTVAPYCSEKVSKGLNARVLETTE